MRIKYSSLLPVVTVPTFGTCWCGRPSTRLFSTEEGPMCYVCEDCYEYWTNELEKEKML